MNIQHVHVNARDTCWSRIIAISIVFHGVWAEYSTWKNTLLLLGRWWCFFFRKLLLTANVFFLPRSILVTDLPWGNRPDLKDSISKWGLPFFLPEWPCSVCSVTGAHSINKQVTNSVSLISPPVRNQLEIWSRIEWDMGCTRNMQRKVYRTRREWEFWFWHYFG